MIPSTNYKQLIEIASWRLMSEYMRHLPPRYILIEYQPGMGYGNSLAIIDRTNRHILTDYSRAGQHSIFMPKLPTFSNPRINEDVLNKDLKDILMDGLKRMGLPVNGKVPASSAQVLTYRTIAAILSTAAFGTPFWECKSGCLDSSVDGYGQRTELFKNYPEALKRTKTPAATDFDKNPNYNFWFILKDEKPVCCLDIAGLLWTVDGKKISLTAEYKKHRKLTPVVLESIAHHLP